MDILQSLSAKWLTREVRFCFQFEKRVERGKIADGTHV